MKPTLNLTLLLGLSVMLTACAVPPKGDSQGRISVYDTTRDEARSPRILPVSLIEFSEQAADQFAQDLSSAPVLREAQGRVTIVLGDINNQTELVNTSEFRAASQRMRSILINSSYVRERVRWVENRARLQAIAAREDVVREDGSVATPDPYDASTTYVLNASFFNASRRDTHNYYMEFTLAHFETGEIVFSAQSDAKHVEVD